MSVKKEALVGLDIGTGGCKISIIDLSGTLLVSNFQEYPTYYPAPGWAEQNPKDWYESVKTCFKKTLKRSDFNLIALCIDGQPHTPVFLNDKKEVLGPSIPWIDQRTEKEVSWLKRRLNDGVKITYNPLNTAFTMPQLLWVIRHKPKLWKQTHKLLIAKDFIRINLCEEVWCTDPSDAIGTYLFDGRKFQWSDELCEVAGIDMNKLPTIEPSARIIGYVTKNAYKETGIPDGIPVLTGAHDPSMENLSAGTVSPNQGFIKLATAGVISVTTKNPRPDPKERTVTYCLPTTHEKPSGWFTKTATLSCGSSNRWFRDVFCSVERIKAEEHNLKAYKLMDDLATKAPLGAEGLIFHPYLLGEGSPYWDSSLKGSFTGITLRHKKEHFCRAVLEGITFSIYDSLRVFHELPIPIVELKIIGGKSESPLWRRIVSDVFGMKITKPRFQDASYGSALLAGVGINVFRGLNDATSFVKVEAPDEPEEANHKEYMRYFSIFRKIHDDLKDVYEEIEHIV